MKLPRSFKVIIGAIFALLLVAGCATKTTKPKVAEKQPPVTENPKIKAEVGRYFAETCGTDEEDGVVVCESSFDEDPYYIILYGFTTSGQEEKKCQKNLIEMFEVLIYESQTAQAGKIGIVLFSKETGQELVQQYLSDVLITVFTKRSEPIENIIPKLQKLTLLIQFEYPDDEASEIRQTIQNVSLPLVMVQTEDKEDIGGMYIGKTPDWRVINQQILDFDQNQ